MKLSMDGYKRNSKDKNNPYNIIPSGDITMEGVDFPVMGTDNLGNQQLMQPGFNYKFPGNMVFEQPVQEKPKNQVKNRRIDRDNKLLPNWTEDMGDVSSHLMTTIEMTDDDGSPIYIAIPMLYPVIEGQETPDPTTWKEFKTGEEEDAFKMALERGEVYYFNSAEEADEFAKGGYKTPNLKKKKYGGSLPKAETGNFPWGIKGQGFSNIQVPGVNWAEEVPELIGTEAHQGVNVSGLNLSKDFNLGKNLNLNLSNPAFVYARPTLNNMPVSNFGAFKALPFEPRVSLSYNFKDGGSLPKAQWQNIANAYKGVKNAFNYLKNVNPLGKNAKISKELSETLDAATLRNTLNKVDKKIIPFEKTNSEKFYNLSAKDIKESLDNDAFINQAKIFNSSDKLPLTRVLDAKGLTIKDGKLFSKTGDNYFSPEFTNSRNTTHWSYGHIGDPGHGSWSSKSTAIINDFDNLKKFGHAMDLDPTDTYFYTKGDFEIPSNSLILTRDKELYNKIKKESNITNIKLFENTPNDEFEAIVNSFSTKGPGKYNYQGNLFNEYIHKNWEQGIDVAQYKPASYLDFNKSKHIKDNFGGGSSKIHHFDPTSHIESISGLGYSKKHGLFSEINKWPDSRDYGKGIGTLDAMLEFPKPIQIFEMDKLLRLYKNKPEARKIQKQLAEMNGFKSYKEFKESVDMTNFKKYGGQYKYGGSLPKAQLQLTKYYDEIANLLGKADDFKSLLPSPIVSTLPYQKLLTFNQTGQVIPQQHMVNPNRGAASLNDALNDLYSGEPMWFAPVGDTRYFDNSLESFGKLNEDALDFVPGAGRPILRYIRDQKGNTGKWGFNEYPLTDAEKLTKLNRGYEYKYVVDENGNGKYVIDYDNPIMRTELITKPDFQSKIIGDFAPDIKFKIFDDFDLSRQGHAMHKVWKPEEFQSILDEGFDAIQLVKDGIQIENILLNPNKFKIRSINEMPVHIDNPPFATGGTLPKAQLQNLPKIWNTGKSILQRPWNINTWMPNTGHISGLNIGATSASNYSANALKNLENITRIKDQELLNSITNNYSKILSGDIDAQNNLEQFARLNPDALITLGQSDDPYLNAIMNRNKNISIGSWAGENKDIGASGSELFKNMSSYNPDGLLIENIPTLSGGTTSLTMGPNTMPTVDPIYNLFTPAKGAGAWQGSNQHTYLMSKTGAHPSLILSGDKGFVSRGNDDGWFSGRWLTRNIGPNRLNANWDSNYGIRGTTGQSILDKVGLLDEQFNLDEPLEGTFMQFYNPPEKTYGNIGDTSIETEIIGKDIKRNGGSLPKHQIKQIVKHGDDAIDGLNLLNKNIKSVFLFDKTKPLTLMDDLGYRIKPNTLKEITNRQDLIKQYNLRNNQYRTVNINDGVLNNEQLISGAKIAGYNPNAADELAAYMGTTPTLGLGRRAGFEGTQRNVSDILYTGDFPHITEGRYRTGNPKNTWTVKSNLWEDDIASLSDQQLFDRITLLDNPWSANDAHNIYNVGDLAKFKSMSDINAPHGSILNTLSTKVPNLLQTNMIYGNAFEPVRKPLGLIRSDDLNRSLKLSGNKFDTFKEGGSIKDRYNKKLSKFQLEGENNPGWLAKRLYNSVTPIGYNIDQAMVEMLHGEKQPFMWDGVETSFADFQNHPRFKDNLQLGEYIKNASEDLWGMYLGFDQKHNTVSKSKFKPTLGIENDETTYYSFNNVDDIMDDIIERGITQDITNDEWQIEDSAAGGFNLNNYQLSRGMDDEKELPYISYYDEYDFDIPTGLGFNIEGESIVGKPFDIYGRIYYNPETNELIHPSELDANWVDFEKLKQGIAYAESLNGELMINPESTATGLYGQRFSEIKDMYNGTREDFAKDIDAQNEFFENRYRDNLEGVKGLRQSGIDLYKEYSSQIPNFPYSTTEVAALVNFLGRQGAREYFGYVLREGNTLESVFPDKYGPNAQQANKTPQEYIEKFNEGIIKKKMGGEVDKLTDRLIKKYEEGGKLTPAGTKHLKSLGMI